MTKTKRIETVVQSAAAAREKVSALRNRLRDIHSDQRRLSDARWAIENADEKEKIDEAATALLADVGAEIPEGIADLDRSLRKLAGDELVVSRALFQARQDLNVVKRQEANEVVKQLRPAHRKAVARIAHALTLLEQANADEAKIRAQVPGGGASLPCATFPGIGGRRVDCSPAFFWFRFARERGLLDEFEVEYSDAAD